MSAVNVQNTEKAEIGFKPKARPFYFFIFPHKKVQPYCLVCSDLGKMGIGHIACPKSGQVGFSENCCILHTLQSHMKKKIQLLSSTKVSGSKVELEDFGRIDSSGSQGRLTMKGGT